jgi:dTDP-glucose 4,6-dehydratase
VISELDLEHIVSGVGSHWEALRGRRIFVTGGTGFVGKWLLEGFVHANRSLELGAELVALTRAPERFRAEAPHLAAAPGIVLHAGDAADFAFPEGDFAAVVHAATERPFTPSPERPLGVVDADLAATCRVLEFARRTGAERFLFTSSGAAYGPQPPELTHVPESFTGAPLTTDTGAAYGHGKRLSEFACTSYARLFGFGAVVARLFAFVGPYLPLDANFAAGNFIGDALAGRPIRIAGDGTPRRSYLYGADLAVWLWTLLLAGESGRIYNVGSPHDVSIRELAEAVADATGADAGIEVAGAAAPGAAPLRYVPDTARAERELGLRAAVGLPDGIRRTFDWHRARGGGSADS